MCHDIRSSKTDQIGKKTERFQLYGARAGRPWPPSMDAGKSLSVVIWEKANVYSTSTPLPWGQSVDAQYTLAVDAVIVLSSGKVLGSGRNAGKHIYESVGERMYMFREK